MAKIIDITPTLDTSVYADGRILFQPTELALAVAAGGGTSLLQTISVTDESDQGVAFDLIFFRKSVTLGTINMAPSISDGDGDYFCGRVSVVASDYYDLGGVRVADPADTARGRLMRADDNQTSLWVAGISRGAGTYAATGLKLKFGFVT